MSDKSAQTTNIDVESQLVVYGARVRARAIFDAWLSISFGPNIYASWNKTNCTRCTAFITCSSMQFSTRFGLFDVLCRVHIGVIVAVTNSSEFTHMGRQQCFILNRFESTYSIRFDLLLVVLISRQMYIV